MIRSFLSRPLRSLGRVCAWAVPALLLAACAQKGEPPVAAAPAQPVAVPQAAAPAGEPSQARTIAGYKAEVARRVYDTSNQHVFTGQPPPLLRSIVVVNVVIDENGNLLSARVYRDNGDVEMRNLALASLKRAAPLPRPTRAVLRSGQIEYLESWLFRRDGKFQVRSLAELQASE